MAERLSVPGFLAARVFVRKTDQARRYFILYDLAGAAVLSSDAYLARLNNPTAWSRRIMTLITNFRRGGGAVLKQVGYGRGGVATVTEIEPGERLFFDWRHLTDRVCTASLMVPDGKSTRIDTVEKSLRGGDASVSDFLMVEAVDVRALTDFHEKYAPDQHVQCVSSDLYDLVFSAT